MTNMSIKSGYDEVDNLQVANSNDLLISHIGSATIPTSSVNLKLSNILYVPFVTQYLIYVSKLYQTNKVNI